MLGYAVQVALVCDVQDLVGVLDHRLTAFLGQFEELHTSRVQRVPFCDPVCDDVHTGHHFVLVRFMREDWCIVAD